VHELLAEVEWAALGDPEKLAAAWAARGARPDATKAALACLRAPELADVWVRPAGLAEVWRERAFEVVLDGAWVSGVFDRVVVGLPPGRATVFDIKTGPATTVAPHAGQLGLYRRAAARLTGLPEAAIRVEVVFTAVPARVRVT
jgi:RecB family exonuclease